MKKLMILVLVLVFVGSAAADSVTVGASIGGAATVSGNNSGDNYCIVWGPNPNYSGCKELTRGFIKFVIPELGAGEYIESATLSLQRDSWGSSTLDTYITRIAAADSGWAWNTVSYNTPVQTSNQIYKAGWAMNELVSEDISNWFGTGAGLWSPDGNQTVSVRLMYPGSATSGKAEVCRNRADLILEVVPEPATIALLGLGGLALIRRKSR